MVKFLAYYFVLLFCCSDAISQAYNIVDFGARTDSTFLNTKSIQAAIEKCYSNGGGQVTVPAGTYYTGTIFLKSQVYLNLAPGAVLQGSYNPSDYPAHPILAAKKYGTITHNGLFVQDMKAIIIADNAHHTGILGLGTVKGAGEGNAFQLGLNKDGKPKNIFFISCKDVILQGITILNSAQVTVSISGCERVRIDQIYIRSLVNWNCDGLDLDAKDVTISNSIIDSEDDAMCFKSEYLGKFCENIMVTNCIFSSLCNGIKFGTGSRTGFRNVTINNCVVKKASFNGYRHWKMTPDIVDEPAEQSVNTGIVILGVDGGLVENINISHLIMTDVLSPIFIRAGARFMSPENKPSVMRHISIRNVRVESRSIIPSIIAGLDGAPVEDIQLSNIHVSNRIGVDKEFLKSFPSSIREDLKGYPENRLTFGTKLPASAFYVRHAKNISFANVSIVLDENESRIPFYVDDATSVKLRNVIVNGKKIQDAVGSVAQVNSQKIEVTD